MKLILRADDVGYDAIHDMGAFETLTGGLATSVDLMLDTPGAVSAMDRLRALPWISVGWHVHFWGAPVLPAERVPSLIEERNGQIRFRRDLMGAQDVVFDEILEECRAQIRRCIMILGRAPDTGETFGWDSPCTAAVAEICREYGIAAGFIRGMLDGDDTGVQDPRWEKTHIYTGNTTRMWRPLEQSGTIEDLLRDYDPEAAILNDTEGLLRQPHDRAVILTYRPGYLDYYTLKEGDPGPLAGRYLLNRPIDIHCLTSKKVAGWIEANGVELVSLRDALYGTSAYQAHLRDIHSPLALSTL